MANLEKVIKGLEETEIMLKQAVDRGGEMAVMGAFKCYNHVSDAIALLKEQEAKVLTVDQLEDALDTVVWLETPVSENLADGYSLIMAYSHKYGYMFFDSPFGDNPSQDRLEYSEYGKSWRCWDKRPTDEQRKAVKWDE